jgi:phage minor structural protein
MQKAKYIEIKTAAGNRAAFLSPRADKIKECYPDCRLNGESTLEFLIPATSPKIVELTPECQIWAGGRVYTLLKDEAVDIVRDKKNTLWAKFMAVERWAELDTQYIEPYISNDPIIPIPNDLEVIIVSGGSDLSGGLYTVGSAAHALYAILQGSGWSVGTVDVTSGVRDLQTEKISRLQLIKEIQDKWGGFLVWDSVNKIVHLRDANTWQNYTGFQIRYKKNLEHITRTQSNKIVTKLYAFGHDGLLDIASVNGGLKYITNYSYTSRTYVGIYKNQDIYYQNELLEKATAELSLICRPRYLYRTNMIDLRTLPEYSHEDFAVGDMADVIDPDVAPESPRVRIIRHKYNLFQPWKCEVEIGDPQERFIERLKASFNTSGFVDTKYNGNGQSSGYSVEDLTIENAKIKNLSADKIIANTLMANVNLIIGSGNNVFKANYLGIFLGHADFASAPFSVDMYGNLYAQSATIQGTINSSTITGGIIRTAASGKRIEISNNKLSSYNASGSKEGFCVEDWSGIYAGLMYEGGSIVGGMVVDSGLTIYSNTNNSEALWIKSGKHMYIQTIDDLGVIYIGGGSTAAVSFSGANVIGLDGYALVDHTHSAYVKTMSSQNLKLQAFEGASVNYVEVWLGSTYLGQVDLV